MIHQGKSKWIGEIAKALCTHGDSANFKKLLIPGSLSLDTAEAMCGYLAQMFPGQAALVAEAVLKAQ